MHWELSDELELFASSLREWLGAKFPTSVVRDCGSPGTAEPVISALISEGWWGVGYPEEAGGQGGGTLELALASREFGRAAVPNSGWLAAAVVAPTLTKAEVSDQVSGDVRYVAAIRADRVPSWNPLEANDGRVSGRVPHVLGATAADVFVVPIRAAGVVRLARVAAEHARVSPENLLDLSRAVATVEFADAPYDEGLEVDRRALDRATSLAATLVSADALGSAERMLELSVEYSKQRKQFGRPIGAFQAVKHAAAQMLVTVEASYSTALYAGAALDAGLDDASTVAAVAKAQVTQDVAELADSALTIHGAIGYTWEHDLQLFYKRAKLDRALFGLPPAWNKRIAGAILGEAGSSDDHP